MRASGALKKEARKAVRYVVGAPVKFSWRDREHQLSGEGVTRDVSPESMFIWAEEPPPLGVSVVCRVFLSRLNMNAPEIELLINGRIFRIEQRVKVHNLVGFVVLNQTISFSTGQTPE